MSVLIPEMDVPERCAECRFLEGTTMDGLCRAARKWFDDDEYWYWYYFEEDDIDDSKPLNCPLVQIVPQYANNEYSMEHHHYCEFKCSLCGAEIGCTWGGNMDGTKFKYCPNCGAEMNEYAKKKR